MKNYSLELVIPFLPIAFNKAKRTHYLKFNELNQSWDNIVYLYSRGKLPPMPLEKAKLTLQRFNYRTLDFDGLVSSFKAPVDALVSAKILKDDTWKITGKWEVDQFFIPKKESSYIKIKIEEVTQGERDD